MFRKFVLRLVGFGFFLAGPATAGAGIAIVNHHPAVVGAGIGGGIAGAITGIILLVLAD